jgi:uncharacterized protein (DUF2267 family)
VLAVMQTHVSEGKMLAILDELPKDIRHLWTDAVSE